MLRLWGARGLCRCSCCLLLYLAVSCCILLYRAASCCIVLHLAASCCILLHLAASCCLFLSLAASSCLFLSLPVSCFTYPYALCVSMQAALVDMSYVRDVNVTFMNGATTACCAAGCVSQVTFITGAYREPSCVTCDLDFST